MEQKYKELMRTVMLLHQIDHIDRRYGPENSVQKTIALSKILTWPKFNSQNKLKLINIVEQIDKMSPKSRKAFRRYKALLLLWLGDSPLTIERKCGESPQWVQRFIDDYNKDGLGAISEDKRGLNGRKPSVATPEVIEFVAKEIRKSPYDDWDGPRIAALVIEKFELQAVSRQTGADIHRKALEILRLGRLDS